MYVQYSMYKSARAHSCGSFSHKRSKRKSLGNSRAFVDFIWHKVKRDSEYQQEDVQDLGRSPGTFPSRIYKIQSCRGSQ